LGTDPGRIKIKALGEEEPIFDNKSTNGDRFNILSLNLSR